MTTPLDPASVVPSHLRKDRKGRTFIARRIAVGLVGRGLKTDDYAVFREVPATPEDVLAGRAFKLDGAAYTLRQLSPWLSLVTTRGLFARFA